MKAGSLVQISQELLSTSYSLLTRPEIVKRIIFYNIGQYELVSSYQPMVAELRRNPRQPVLMEICQRAAPFSQQEK